jgi:hypothetical protein
MAQRNVDALQAAMRDPADGGYYDYAWDCTRWTTRRERCPDDGWVVNPAKPGGTQAAVQWALAALAQAAIPGAPPLAPTP